jgi:hypothetical protein
LLGACAGQRIGLCRRDFHSGAFERPRGGVNLGAKPLVFQHEPLLFLLTIVGVTVLEITVFVVNEMLK